MTRFPEFLPRSVPVRDIMDFLLNILYNHICCKLSERFVTYIAEYSISMVPYSVRSQKLRGPSYHTVPGWGSAEFIDLERFHLQLLEPDFFWDMVKYTLTYVEFSVRLNVIGVDSVPCGT